MSSKNNATELGTKPIGSLLMQYAIPAIIAMIPVGMTFATNTDSMSWARPISKATVWAMASAPWPRMLLTNWHM